MNCIGLLLFYFGPAPLVVWRSPNSTHIQTIFFRAPGAAVLNTAAPVLVGSCQGPTPAPGHVCPSIRIHAIDIVQPPGIGIPPIAHMDAHQTIVTAALAAKSNAETLKKACWEARSEAMRREISSPAVAPRQPRLRSALVVLVVAAPPDA